MRHMLLIAVLALSACTTMPTPPATSTPDRGDAILSVANSAAAVADALDVAPPAILSRTTIDDKAIHLAFQTFETTLIVIDAYVATHPAFHGTPNALRLRTAILATKAALQAASAAQRAGSAASYTAALHEAETALAGVRQAFAGEQR